MRAATLADVGRAAGVSAMAASAVLNRAQTSSRISAETRDRIFKAASRLRYRPNAAARALANRRMNTIGVAAVIERGELNQYFLEVFNGVLEAAANNDQNATVFTLHNWEGDAARLNGFCDGRIDGLILVAPLLTGAFARTLPEHTPFVAIHANNALPGVINLETDEETGAYDITRHLISIGHRQILHLTGPLGMLGTERRLRGYRRALATSGIPFDKTLVIVAGYNIHDGREVMRAWLKRSAGQPLPQAIVCANDSIAIGCLESLAEVGIKAPQEISVTGFDDTLSARTAVPQLTTVRQPLRAMGARAVDVLLGRIRHQQGHTPDEAPKSIIFPVEIVVRDSVQKPPKTPAIVPTPSRR